MPRTDVFDAVKACAIRQSLQLTQEDLSERRLQAYLCGRRIWLVQLKHCISLLGDAVHVRSRSARQASNWISAFWNSLFSGCLADWAPLISRPPKIFLKKLKEFSSHGSSLAAEILNAILLTQQCGGERLTRFVERSKNSQILILEFPKRLFWADLTRLEIRIQFGFPGQMWEH